MLQRPARFVAFAWLSATAAVSSQDAPVTAPEPQQDWRHRQLQTWPQWRGPLGTGFAPAADPPTRWSETENVLFKTELPGAGYGSPVVWADSIFLTAAIAFGPDGDPVPDDAPDAHDNAKVTRRHRFVALAVDRRNGEILWQKTLHEQMPHAVFHNSGALASASAVTDGEHVFAFFG